MKAADEDHETAWPEGMAGQEGRGEAIRPTQELAYQDLARASDAFRDEMVEREPLGRRRTVADREGHVERVLSQDRRRLDGGPDVPGRWYPVRFEPELPAQLARSAVHAHPVDRIGRERLGLEGAPFLAQ